MPMVEAEYIALDVAAQHLHDIWRMCIQVGGVTAAAPCELKSDNMAVVAMMAEPHGTERRTFIYLRHQMLQHLVFDGAITTSHVRSRLQKANMLKKSSSESCLSANVRPYK